jgi:hypothetical protein
MKTFSIQKHALFHRTDKLLTTKKSVNPQYLQLLWRERAYRQAGPGIDTAGIGAAGR